MCLRFRRVSLAFAFAWALAASAAPLRFCADPDNLPFSNRESQGFDNQIAVLVAHALHREPVFVWTRNGRGFIREQFNRNACDVLISVPQQMLGVLTTAAYYRSSYVFVTRMREHLQIASFDDPRLNGRKIGLQALEDNLSPPSLALIRTGHAAQLIGMNSFGAHGGDIMHAVAKGSLGAAVVWGPLAGYFTKRDHLPLRLTPVEPLVDKSGVPFSFSIAMAVHRHDDQLRDQLNSALVKLQPRIGELLAAFNVPTLPIKEAQ